MANTTEQRLASRILSCIYILAWPLKFPIQTINEETINLASVFPGSNVELQVDPDIFLYVIQTICGVGLLMGSRRVKISCTEMLMIVMLGEAFTLYTLGRYCEVITPATLLTALTYLRYSYWTDRRKKKHRRH